MKNFKRIALACVAIVSLLFVTPLTVSAAVTSNEQRIIDALVDAEVPAKYVTLAKQYLAGSTVELTAAEVDEILANIAGAKKLVDASSLSKVIKDPEQFNKFAAFVVGAGKGARLVVTVNADDIRQSTITGITLQSLLDGSKSTSDIIKNTGDSFSSTYLWVAGLIALLGVTTVVAKKKELI